MQYSKLVLVYLELEKTTKKLEKAEIISNFLKGVNKEEIKDVIHLLQGKIFPDYDQRKIGMSSRLILKVIAMSTGISMENVEKTWKSIGDLGIVAQELLKKRKQTTLLKEELTIRKVVQNIEKLSLFEGEGTVDKKVKLISELLNSAEPEEARFIVGTVLEELRVGVAAGIIRDALAKVFEVDVNLIERAYNLTTDYGDLASLLKTRGIKALHEVSLKIGTPTKSMLAVLVLSVEEAFEALGKPAQFENKIDGFRMQVHKDNDIKIYTRNLEDVTKQFPDVVDYVKENVNAKTFILDCEAVAYDRKNNKHLPFQNISQRIKRKYDIKELSEKFPVEVNVFDILFYNGNSLMDMPLNARRNIIEKIVKQKKGKIVLTKKLVTDDVKKAKAFYNESLKNGDEGVMIKNINVNYIPGRYVNGWTKLKNILDPLDLVVIKAEYGNGKRAKWLTSYTLACKSGNEFLEVGKVSTGVKEKTEGLTYEEMTKMLKPLITYEKGKEIIVKPKIIIEVGYEEIQKSPSYTSGFALRFPKVLKFRQDKPLDEISDINLVKKIYSSQRGKKL